MKALRREREKLFQKLSLDAVIVRTDGSFVDPIRKLFQMRARRIHR
jgi:hypothetical protein